LKGCGLNFLSNRTLQIKKLIFQFVKVLIHQSNVKINQILEIGMTRVEISRTSFIKGKEKLKFIQFKIERLINGLRSDLYFRRLLQDIGILNRHQAEKTGAVGPIARASGIFRDLRMGDPYSGYLEIPFKPVFSRSEDIWGIFKVRIEEIRESIRVINFILEQENITSEKVDFDKIDLDQDGQMTARIETPQGPGLYSIESDPQMRIKGLSIQNPTLTNITSLEARLMGVPVVHAARIIQSYDLSFTSSKF
jgi:Ni,Fe-hydrogenase III large subunit